MFSLYIYIFSNFSRMLKINFRFFKLSNYRKVEIFCWDEITDEEFLASQSLEPIKKMIPQLCNRLSGILQDDFWDIFSVLIPTVIFSIYIYLFTFFGFFRTLSLTLSQWFSPDPKVLSIRLSRWLRYIYIIYIHICNICIHWSSFSKLNENVLNKAWS